MRAHKKLPLIFSVVFAVITIAITTQLKGKPKDCVDILIVFTLSLCATIICLLVQVHQDNVRRYRDNGQYDYEDFHNDDDGCYDD